MQYINEILGAFYIIVTAYLFVLAVIVNAPGWYVWMFKVFPVILGLVSAFYALRHYEYIIPALS